MKKNCIYLFKRILKLAIVIFLIVLLVRYAVHINIIISKVSSTASTRNSQSNDNDDSSSSKIVFNKSVEFDFYINLIDSFGGHSSSSSAAAKTHDLSSSSDKKFIFVNNFTEFLNSKFFYYDRLIGNVSDDQNKLPICSYVPKNLKGRSVIVEKDLTMSYVEEKYSNEFSKYSGGHWKPKHCQAHSKVAIIVPYRDREKQLIVFLDYMHEFLQKQTIDYAIYIIEEAPNIRFNRALLMNIGYNESIKDYDWSCFIFHDVDLVPEDDRNFYYCPSYPRHMSTCVNTFDYKLPYKEIMGGVTAVNRKHFELVNGFSNLYFGWGGEDDDFSERVTSNNLKIIRYPEYISRYYMLFHEKDSPSKQRYNLLNSAKSRFKTDGLNSLKYTVLKKELRRLYTWVQVSFEEPKSTVSP